MKLKIKIVGPKVHGVGYRYFLMDTALDISLRGFNARNRIENGQQQVLAFIEGDEESLADFRKIVETAQPKGAEVSGISFCDYEGEIMSAGEYSQICTAHQLHKAIPLLLDIRDDLKEVKTDLKAVKTNTDVNPQIAENTKPVPQILEEIKGLKEEQPGLAMQLRQVQEDIRAIKARLGMP